MSFHARVMAALEQAGDHTAQFSQRAAQREARDAGWPKEEAAKIRAHHSDGYLHVNADTDWEYGDEDRPPNAVARQFLNHAENHADLVFQHKVMEHLADLL